MTAITSDRDTNQRGDSFVHMPVKASTKIPFGTLVSLDSSGWAIPATDTSGTIFVGVSAEQQDNSDGSNGDLNIKVWTTGVYNLGYSTTVAKTVIGSAAYVQDNQTVGTVGSTTNDIKAGVIKQVDLVSEEVWLDIGKAA